MERLAAGDERPTPLHATRRTARTRYRFVMTVHPPHRGHDGPLGAPGHDPLQWGELHQWQARIDAAATRFPRSCCWLPGALSPMCRVDLAGGGPRAVEVHAPRCSGSTNGVGPTWRSTTYLGTFWARYYLPLLQKLSPIGGRHPRDPGLLGAAAGRRVVHHPDGILWQRCTTSTVPSRCSQRGAPNYRAACTYTLARPCAKKKPRTMGVLRLAPTLSCSPPFSDDHKPNVDLPSQEASWRGRSGRLAQCTSSIFRREARPVWSGKSRSPHRSHNAAGRRHVPSDAGDVPRVVDRPIRRRPWPNDPSGSDVPHGWYSRLVAPHRRRRPRSKNRRTRR